MAFTFLAATGVQFHDSQVETALFEVSHTQGQYPYNDDMYSDIPFAVMYCMGHGISLEGCCHCAFPSEPAVHFLVLRVASVEAVGTEHSYNNVM